MLLRLVPRFMRTWPVLRRWYWQQDELDEAKRRAHQRWLEFQRYVD